MSFREWQQQYAAYGIATFPVAVRPDGKKPLVSNYARLGLPGSSEIAQKFADATGIGFMVGEHTRVTVLDIDSPDERLLADALNRYGPTPLIARSGSGNHQGWYRHNGEKRLIRIAESGKPIDILGAGFVVAPPSQGVKSDYKFLRGSLDDLDSLPVLCGIEPKSPSLSSSPVRDQVVAEGRRNDTLWRHCMRSAHFCDDIDALLDVARTRNAEFYPPLPDDEVVKTVKSAWSYKERDEIWFGSGGCVAMTHTTVDRLAAADPYALALLSILKRYNGGRDKFVLANAMASKLGWSLRMLKAARKRLVDAGEIRCISPGGRGAHDPPWYAWK